MAGARTVRSEIDIQTADGTAHAVLVKPEAGGRAGVILYMDAFGLRPSIEAMAERLAGEGYTVLAPDTLYRFQPYGPYDAATAFDDEENAKKIRSMIGGTTQAMTIADTKYFIEALEKAGVTGPIGAVGYCMGGSRALNAAAHYPDRIAAAASFHGGGLAGDGEDAPYLHAGKIKGRIYVGSAGVDKSFPPEQSAKLARALREAEVDHIIENYVGMKHGWAVADHDVYDEAGAERHWKRLTEFFEETLKRQ